MVRSNQPNCSSESRIICCSSAPKPKNVLLEVLRSARNNAIEELARTPKACHVSKLGSHRNVSESSVN